MDLDGVRRRRTMVTMAEKKTGDPRDGEQHVGGAQFVPIAAPISHIAIIVPGPLTAGRPKPEPEERWTLAPGHHHGPATDANGEAPAEAAPVEPVRGMVTRPAAEDSEPEPA